MRLFRFGFLKEGLIQTVLEMIKTGYYERGHWSHKEQVWTQRQREEEHRKGGTGLKDGEHQIIKWAGCGQRGVKLG